MNKQYINKILAKTWITLLKLSHVSYYQSIRYDQFTPDEDIILSIANTHYETHRLALEAQYNVFTYN